MSEMRQLCTFYVDRMFLGVPALGVQEVLPEQPMTPVPLAPRFVKGLMNLRGTIVTAVDLRARFGIGPRTDGRPPTNVVVYSGDESVSLLVDDAGDVIELDEATMDGPPETLPRALRELLVGIHKLDGTLLMVLDRERAVAP